MFPASYLPIVGWLPRYRAAWFTTDMLAALSVWALLVPQALAYATLAGAPVQYGLYTAFAALVAYAVFGTSRQVVQGPSATVAAVSGAVVAPIVGAASVGTSAAAAYSAALALVSAVVYLLLGVFRMGWVSNFLSRAVLAGFIMGFAFGIIIDQSYKLLGVQKSDGSYAEILVGTLKQIPDTNPTTLAVGAGSLVLLLVLRRYLPRFPRALLVMMLSIMVVGGLDLVADGVGVTGNVPTGLFSVQLPGVGWSHLRDLLVGAFSVVFVGYSETLASARSLGLKHGYDIDPNQELIAQGASCAAAGFVGGFVTDGSLSKSSVADTAGQRSQMASLLNALLVLLTMILLAGLFKNLPSAVLGAVVIDSMIGLIDFSEMKRYYRVNRPDWVFFMGAALGMLFFGIIQGILIGVVLSLLLLVARASRPAIRVLGHEPRSHAYLDPDRHAGLTTTPGVLVVRIDGPLFFADADVFRDRVSALIDEVDGVEAPVRAVVLDAGAVSQTDTDGADILVQVTTELRRRGATLVLANVHGVVGDLWRRAGAIEAVGEDRVFDTVHQAVQALEPAPAAGSSQRYFDRRTPTPD